MAVETNTSGEFCVHIAPFELPALTSCSAVCTLLIWVCMCNICCRMTEGETVARKLNEVRRAGGGGEMSLIRQIKTDWICSKMAGSMTRACLLSTANCGPGCSFPFQAAKAHLRGGRRYISPFPLLYTCLSVLFEIQTEDRVIGDDM